MLVETLVMVILTTLVILALLFSGLYYVKPSERALYYRGRRFIRELPPGLIFVTPLVGRIVRIERELGGSSRDGHIPTWEEIQSLGMDRRR